MGSLLGTDWDAGVVHARSAQVHADSAERHDAAAAAWDANGDTERADLERARASLERQLATLEEDRGMLLQLGTRDGDYQQRVAEIDRLRTDIRRRAAKLNGDDFALQRERARLDGERRYRGPRRERVARRTRQSAYELWQLISRVAETLEASAALAEQHAVRQDTAGRPDAAAEERRVAERARGGAERARRRAEDWLARTRGEQRTSR